eukprot:6625788-Pyramimonas_sp.AAC.1
MVLKLEHWQQTLGWRAGNVQSDALASAPGACMNNSCNSFKGSSGKSHRSGDLARFGTVRAPRSQSFAVLES